MLLLSLIITYYNYIISNYILSIIINVRDNYQLHSMLENITMIVQCLCNNKNARWKCSINQSLRINKNLRNGLDLSGVVKLINSNNCQTIYR